MQFLLDAVTAFIIRVHIFFFLYFVLNDIASITATHHINIYRQILRTFFDRKVDFYVIALRVEEAKISHRDRIISKRPIGTDKHRIISRR